jgi:hypothetical protein
LAASGASKITPHEFDALLKFGVTLLKVFDVFGHEGVVYRFFIERRTGMLSPAASAKRLCRAYGAQPFFRSLLSTSALG